MAIGQAGSLSTNSPTENAPITVTFDEPLTDPIIVLTGSNNGGNAYVLRVTEIALDAAGNATGFTFIMEEWEYLDGPHPAVETINWLAVEEGVHTLPDGRVIEAGTTTATHANSTVALNGSFDAPPVVLTSVMSNNDTTTVDSDPWNITNTGFTVSLQEEEGQDGIHAPETVGYIAIQPGPGAVLHDGLDENTDIIGLGGTFADPVTLAETQTMNGSDPASVMLDGGDGSTTVGLWLQEEQSADAETNHVNETVGVVTFEDGLIPCFLPGTLIDTPHGPRDIETLAQGDLVLTADNGPQPLRMISRTGLSARDLARAPDLVPIRIAAGALGPGVPSRDLVVSPQHRMLICGWRAQLMFGACEVLAPARGLINDHTIRPLRRDGPVTYLHLAFDDHQVITANGAASESLHVGQVSKWGLSGAARNELFTLFPHLRTAPRDGGPSARPTLTVGETRAIA